MVRRKASIASPPKVLTTAIEIPVLRGVQGGREYYTGMVRLGHLKKLFKREEEDIPPELRAQRILNLGRARKIRDYVIENPTDYVLNSLTVTIDADIEFVGIQEHQDWGMLRVDPNGKFYICDGQHRNTGLTLAVIDRPDLADETIPVTFFLYTGLKRAQQVFHDLNNYSVKPPSSLNMTYEHRDPAIELTKAVVRAVPTFARFTDFERTSLPRTSSKLFTLNAIAAANQSLLKTCTLGQEEKTKLAIGFWKEVAAAMVEWNAVCDKTLAASEVRQNYVHTYSVVLEAIGAIGWVRLSESGWVLTMEISDRLQRLKDINWERSNPDWNDVFIFGEKIRKDRGSIVRLGAVLMEKTNS